MSVFNHEKLMSQESLQMVRFDSIWEAFLTMFYIEIIVKRKKIC